MSKIESQLRQSTIIKILRKRPIPFREIHEILLENRDYNLACSKRTFERDLKEIESLYGIEITYNRSIKAYEISEEFISQHEERLMEAFDLLNALNYTEKHSQNLYLEKRKSLGSEHFHGLLHAIGNQLEITFLHEKYWDSQSGKQKRRVHPIALKESHFRWYLVAEDTNDQMIKTFGLDRISDLDIEKHKFPKKDFDVDEYFKHSFGVVTPNGKKPEEIILSFDAFQGKYVKSLPFHPSQEIIKDNKNELRIKLFLVPTFDFEKELLSYADRVTVIKPKSLINTLKKRMQDAIDNYQ